MNGDAVTCSSSLQVNSIGSTWRSSVKTHSGVDPSRTIAGFSPQQMRKTRSSWSTAAPATSQHEARAAAAGASVKACTLSGTPRPLRRSPHANEHSAQSQGLIRIAERRLDP